MFFQIEETNASMQSSKLLKGWVGFGNFFKLPTETYRYIYFFYQSNQMLFDGLLFILLQNQTTTCMIFNFDNWYVGLWRVLSIIIPSTGQLHVADEPEEADNLVANDPEGSETGTNLSETGSTCKTFHYYLYMIMFVNCFPQVNCPKPKFLGRLLNTLHLFKYPSVHICIHLPRYLCKYWIYLYIIWNVTS